jgi:hypothetical protein
MDATGGQPPQAWCMTDIRTKLTKLGLTSDAADDAEAILASAYGTAYATAVSS